MNKCLSDNQKLWKDRVGLLEKKIDDTIRQKEEEMKELQDQVRDLMFYLETQKKIAESPEDRRQVNRRWTGLMPTEDHCVVIIFENELAVDSGGEGR